jgi:alanine-synthesizing transaminase
VFSKRAHWTAAVNELTLARRSRTNLLDLTETNPTRAALPYPLDALSDALGRAARASYDPDPRGLLSAREALAANLHCEPDDLLLTASTSEAYSFLFKLLTDPGDALLTATPSYPLLEHLAQMEHVELRTFAMEYHRRWEIHDVPVDAKTRAILVVNPNNPTGSFVSASEQDALARYELPIVSDEVFLDYPLEGRGQSFIREDVLTFTLGGLSKSAGLPHFKLGWIRVSGPGKREALDALEMIADNYLSVATPVQIALPQLLPIGATIREALSQRTRRNLASLRAMQNPAIEVLPVEGGWSAVLRVPRVMSDEELALVLLDRGVVVQPGYFFDFDRDGYLVVSLLTEEETFARGAKIIAGLSFPA